MSPTTRCMCQWQLCVDAALPKFAIQHRTLACKKWKWHKFLPILFQNGQNLIRRLILSAQIIKKSAKTIASLGLHPLWHFYVCHLPVHNTNFT